MIASLITNLGKYQSDVHIFTWFFSPILLIVNIFKKKSIKMGSIYTFDLLFNNIEIPNKNKPIKQEKIEFEVYGYAIEFKFKEYKKSDWERFYNYKIYKTEDIAKEAISYIKWSEVDFRIIPLYVKK